MVLRLEFGGHGGVGGRLSILASIPRVEVSHHQDVAVFRYGALVVVCGVGFDVCAPEVDVVS